jgi:CheY-like chemotaxis protein
MSDQTILLIEDNPLNQELATDLLELAGYTVISASNAEEGLQAARSDGVALVLMDISLPGMDGLTATRFLRADPRTSHLPVVALTAHAMKGDEQMVREAGCVGYITKPIDTRSFCRTVASYCAPPQEGRKAA